MNHERFPTIFWLGRMRGGTRVLSGPVEMTEPLSLPSVLDRQCFAAVEGRSLSYQSLVH